MLSTQNPPFGLATRWRSSFVILPFSGFDLSIWVKMLAYPSLYQEVNLNCVESVILASLKPFKAYFGSPLGNFGTFFGLLWQFWPFFEPFHAPICSWPHYQHWTITFSKLSHRSAWWHIGPKGQAATFARKVQNADRQNWYNILSSYKELKLMMEKWKSGRPALMLGVDH